MNKKKIGLAALALALCIGIASATLLTQYGSIETTINVDASIFLDEQDYETPIVETLNVNGGYYYSIVHCLENHANVPVDMKFDAVPYIEGISVRYCTTAHLTAIGEPAGKETSVVIPMPEGTTLGDIETITWLVFTVYGYPPHVDITLDTGDPDADMLTAEIAYNNAMEEEIIEGFTYNAWLKTFELSSGDGYGQIDDNTMLWVTHLGAGNDDAPWGTLKDWKDGVVANDPGGDGLEDGVIIADTPVLKLEIEVDNWIMDTEAYVGRIEINGELVEQLITAENTPFTLQPDELLYFWIEYLVDTRVPKGLYTITTFVEPVS